MRTEPAGEGDAYPNRRVVPGLPWHPLVAGVAVHQAGRGEGDAAQRPAAACGSNPLRPGMGYPQSPFYRAIQFAAPLTEQNWHARPVFHTVPQGYPQHIPMHGEQNGATTTTRRVSQGNTIIRRWDDQTVPLSATMHRPATSTAIPSTCGNGASARVLVVYSGP
jgi:hypothetical protein